MSDQILGSRGDPRQVANAELTSRTQRECDRHPRSVRQCLGARRRRDSRALIQRLADVLGAREVQAQQIAAIDSRDLILTSVAMSP
jgi:hypothetical protein